MRGGFGNLRGMGRLGDTNTAAAVPPSQGGNAVQGKGIVFVYQTPNVATLNHGNASGSQVIQFDNNSTFLWLSSTFTADIAAAAFTAATQPLPLITATIQDTGNGMQFMNAALPVYQIAGIEPGFPYILPTPQLIQPNASYSFNFSNYDAAVNYTNVRMQLHGFRIFRTDITSMSQLRGQF